MDLTYMNNLVLTISSLKITSILAYYKGRQIWSLISGRFLCYIDYSIHISNVI